MQEIKAIPTEYNNHTFRSRMEARWALFFDVLGVKWTYEPDVYDIGDGQKYFPDFYFPEYDFFAEIKPTEFNEIEERKWIKFCNINKKPLLLLIGNPHAKISKLYLPIQYINYSSWTGYREVIPFICLYCYKYGLFWWGHGDEDYSNEEPFKSAIIKANSQKYYTLQK